MSFLLGNGTPDEGLTRCSYCGVRRAIHIDHIPSKAIRRRYHIDAKDSRYHTKSCGECNWRKGTRKFYPKGFDVSLLPGTGWIEWDGGKLPEVRR